MKESAEDKANDDILISDLTQEIKAPDGSVLVPAFKLKRQDGSEISGLSSGTHIKDVQERAQHKPRFKPSTAPSEFVKVPKDKKGREIEIIGTTVGEREKPAGVLGGPIFVQRLPDLKGDKELIEDIEKVDVFRGGICPAYVKDTNPDGNCANLNYNFIDASGKVSCNMQTDNQKVDCTGNDDGTDIQVTLRVTDTDGKTAESVFLVDVE